MAGKKTYDVAISFRWDPDDHVALALYERLTGLGLDVFYSEKRAEEFVGTDGEQSFGEIFRDRSVIVVVLYREHWGVEGFTLAESNAIRQRARDANYSFATYVQMAPDVSMPSYLPRERIYGKWSELGVDGLSAVIVERLQDAGRQPRSVTKLDKAREAFTTAEQMRGETAYLRSRASLEFYDEVVQQLHESIGKSLARVESKIPGLLSVSDLESTTFTHNHIRWVASGYAGNLGVVATQAYADSAWKAAIKFFVRSRNPSARGYQDEHRDIEVSTATVGLDAEGRPGFRTGNAPPRPIDRIIDIAVDEFAYRCALEVQREAQRNSK